MMTPPETATWSVLIVDDHELYRVGLRELIGDEPGLCVAGEAGDEAAAWDAIRGRAFDLVTVDLSLAGGNGLDIVRGIKTRAPTTAVLVISMFEERVYAQRALAAGASGYVCKQSSSEHIRQALRTIRRGGVYLSEEGVRRLPRRNGEAASPPTVPDEQVLSDRELEILTLYGRGLTTDRIAAELRVAVSTVETYRQRLKAKLRLSSGPELVRYATLWYLENS